MKRPLRILYVSAGAVVALYVAGATLLPLFVNADRLRPQLEARLQAALGRRVSLGALRLSLWSGPALRTESVRVAEPIAGSASSSILAEAGPTLVHVATFPLLRRVVEVRSIEVDGLTVSRNGTPLVSDVRVLSRVRVSPAGAVEASGTIEGSLPAMSAAPRLRAAFVATALHGTIDVKRLDAAVGPLQIEAHGSVKGALSESPRLAFSGSAHLSRSSVTGRCEIVLARSGPKASFTADSPLLDGDELLAALSQFTRRAPGPRSGFSLVPQAMAEDGVPAAGGPAPLMSMDVEGAIRADRCTYRGLEMTNLTMRLSLARGLAEIRDLAFALYGGKAQGELTARPFDPSLPFSLEEAAEGIAIGPLIAALAPAQAGTLQGTASFDLELRGLASGGSMLPSLNGAGKLAIVDGKLARLGAVELLTTTLERAGARGLAKDATFDHLAAHFDIVKGTAATKDLTLRSRDLDGDGAGTVGPGGALQFDVLASFSAPVSADLVAKTPALSVRQDTSGRLSLPLKLRGTIRDPRMQLDLDRVIHEGVLNRTQVGGR